MKKRIERQDKGLLRGAILFLFLIVGICYVSTKESAYAIDITSPTNKEIERYLEVSWPASEHRGAITFQIPEEYLHAGTTWRNKDGSIKSFAIQFELPGPIPVQDRPWLKGKKGTPEYEEFMKTWQGRFSMDIEPVLVGGFAHRDGMRRQALKSDQMRIDTSVYGLERYSTLECFSKQDIEKDALSQRFIANKEEDDFSPKGCRLDRRWAVLVSPGEVNKDDEGVAIRCMSTGCKAYFSVAGCGVSMGISHKDIENWPAVIEPARNLIKSFIKNNA